GRADEDGDVLTLDGLEAGEFDLDDVGPGRQRRKSVYTTGVRGGGHLSRDERRTRNGDCGTGQHGALLISDMHQNAAGLYLRECGRTDAKAQCGRRERCDPPTRHSST